MSETKMPTAEATMADETKIVSYELAFHILPTVVEGEVVRVFDSIKAHIEKAGGEVFDQEAPERFDLAYEIVKYLEGRNRSFGSAYFAWVRFRLNPAQLAAVTAEVEGTKELLRHLLVKLTRTDEAHPFRFHPSVADRKVRVITDEDIAVEEVVEEKTEEVAAPEGDKKEEETV